MHEELNVSRRRFLASASALGIAGLVGPGMHAPDGNPSTAGAHRDLSRMTCAEFAACLGSTFHIGPPGAAVAVELVRAHELRRADGARGEERNPFALLFHGSNPRLPQGTYCVEHDRLGMLTLFLVPVGMGTEPIYEAVFG